MDTTLASSPIGRLLDGRYRVESHLARGGMADVYLGTDTRLQRTVALKIMRAELASDEDFVRRFIGEARSVAQLSHPNVVAVFDQGADGRTLYLAMEYVRGQSLRALLNERGPLSPRAALSVMDGVLAGLAAAHEAGLAHRDVKPENVLISQGSAVKVVDFGLARLVSGVSHTKTGMIIGTAAYLAPEQVARGVTDARSDVYAAGVMLFELLTGRQPHTGDSPLDVAYKHVNEVVPAPSSLAPGLPPALDMLVAMATSRDPELRPGDAGQFLRAITGVRHSLPGGLSPGQSPFPALGSVPGGGEPGEAGAALAPRVPQPDRGPGTELIPGMNPTEDDLIPGMKPDEDNFVPGLVPSVRQSYGVLSAAAPAATTHFQQDGYPHNHTLIVMPGGADDGYGPPASSWGRREPGLQRLLFSRRLGYLVAGLVAVALLGWFGWYQLAGRYATVPKLTGLTVATARSDLRVAGLTARVSGRSQTDNQVPKGEIIRTSPGRGARLGRGSAVLLVVSAGPRMIAVPQVTGQALANAQAMLKQAGLTGSTVSNVPSATIPAGIVISTDPAAGIAWPQPKPVHITVSAGPPLPDFAGQQKGAAEEWAQQSGAKLNEVTVKSSQPAGTVTSQSPAAGSAYTPGEVVTIDVSAGPPPVAVPNVDGMDVNTATQTLQKLGFQVSVTQVGPLNTVFNYSPSGQAPQGSTITLYVGLPHA